MAHANTDPRSETTAVQGHVLTHGCIYRADLQRWEPVASVRPSWNAAENLTLPFKPEAFQDTPEDAMRVAQAAIDGWVADPPRS